jgi:putative addiction module killer protein
VVHGLGHCRSGKDYNREAQNGAGQSFQRKMVWRVGEYRLDWGPGYRVYIGKDGDRLIILLGGGTKKGQQKDIDNAEAIWKEYKERKASQKKK